MDLMADGISSRREDATAIVFPGKVKFFAIGCAMAA